MSKLTISDFLLEFRGRPSTKVGYGRFLRYFNDWLAGQDLEVADLRPADFHRFRKTRNWGGSTPYIAACALKAYMRAMHGKEHPFLKLYVYRPDPGPQRTLKDEEVIRLIQSLDTTTRAGSRDLPLVLLMLDSGLRAQEVTGLLLRNVDLDARILSVEGKGGRWRDAMFSPMTAAYLGDWISGARAEKAEKDTETLFLSIGGLRPGTPLTKDGLRSVFRAMGRRAGIPNLSPHVMRRTFATVSIKLGAPSRLVQLAGGWSSIQMVQRYTQTLRPEDFDGYFATNIITGEDKSPPPGGSRGEVKKWNVEIG